MTTSRVPPEMIDRIRKYAEEILEMFLVKEFPQASAAEVHQLVIERQRSKNTHLMYRSALVGVIQARMNIASRTVDAGALRLLEMPVPVNVRDDALVESISIESDRAPFGIIAIKFAGPVS